MQPVYIGIDIGGTNIRFALVNEKGEAGELHYLFTKDFSSWTHFADRLYFEINECGPENIKGLGVAVAGGIFILEGIVSFSPHIKWLNGINMQHGLSKATGLPVVIDNDANAIAYGEWVYGSGRGLRSFICLSLGSGIGGGIILCGNLYRGDRGLAGEIGHMCVKPGGRKCACGKRGCLEAYSSASGITDIYRETTESEVFGEKLDPDVIFMKAIEGEKSDLAVFRSLGRYLGIAIASLVNIFDIENFILTGGVSHSWKLFYDELVVSIEENLFSPHRGKVKIVKGELGDWAGIKGIASMAKNT